MDETRKIGRIILALVLVVGTLSICAWLITKQRLGIKPPTEVYEARNNSSEIIIPISTSEWTIVRIDGLFELKIVGDYRWNIVTNRDFEHPISMPTESEKFHIRREEKEILVSLEEGQGVDHAQMIYTRK